MSFKGSRLSPGETRDAEGESEAPVANGVMTEATAGNGEHFVCRNAGEVAEPKEDPRSSPPRGPHLSPSL